MLFVRKLLLFVLLTVIGLLASALVIREDSVTAFENILWQEAKRTDIFIESVQKASPSQITKHILDCIEKNHLSVCHIKRAYEKRQKDQFIKIYVEERNLPLSDINLKSGRFLFANEKNKYVSNVESSDPNQVGVLDLNNRWTKIEIRSLDELVANNLTLLHRYTINTNDTLKLKKLIANIESKFNLKIKTLANENDFSLRYWLQHGGAPITILYITVFLIMTYWMFFRFKEFAVGKLFGISNCKIILGVLKDSFIIHLLALLAVGAASGLLAVYFVNIHAALLFFRNRFFYGILFATMSIIVMSLPAIFVILIRTNLMLKDKKPLAQLQKLNLICKFIFTFALILSLTETISNTTILWGQLKNIDVWDKTKHCFKIMQSCLWQDSENKCESHENGWEHNNGNESVNRSETARDHELYNLYKATNKQGGILIDATNYKSTFERCLATRSFRKGLYVKEREIIVNNNYLQVNQIYDVDGNIVDVPDNLKKEITILVPAKFKKDIDKIKEIYGKNHLTHIIYAKDNQKYFAYNIDTATDRNGTIEDVIVEVVGENSYFPSWYACQMTHSYYAKINNTKDPMSELVALSDESGEKVDGCVGFIESVYDMVMQRIYENKQAFSDQIIHLVILVCVSIMIICSITINFLEINKKQNAIEKVHGFANVRRYSGLYIVTFFNALSGVLASYLYKVSDITIYNKTKLFLGYSKIAAILFFFDIIISLTLIRAKENKKINNVLKGEEQ
jgi:hypothetical protein